MNAIIALNALWMSRPGLDATPEQVAAWHVAKGHTLEALARQAPTDAEEAVGQANAAAAYDHARRLRAEAPVGSLL